MQIAEFLGRAENCSNGKTKFFVHKMYNKERNQTPVFWMKVLEYKMLVVTSFRFSSINIIIYGMK